MNILAQIREDISSVMRRDPAAQSAVQVFLLTPGLHAVWAHRIHHWLWRHGFRFIARILSQMTRFYTGVEIHPAAKLGRRLLIDHGMGVVIGETAVVGNDVTLYQGVTLGGTGNADGHRKRHPTLCNNVFVGNNANVLGDITIGENSRVGAGSVVLHDVPPNSTVVGVPGHIVYRNGQRVLITDPHEVKDPLSDALIALSERVSELESQINGSGSGAGTRQPEKSIFGTELADRAAYREELDRERDYVSMGAGI